MVRTEIEANVSILLTCFGLPSQGLILALFFSTNMSSSRCPLLIGLLWT